MQISGLELAGVGWVPPPPGPPPPGPPPPGPPHHHGGGGFFPWWGGWGGQIQEYYPYPVTTPAEPVVSSIFGVDMPTAILIGAGIIALTIIIATRKK